MNDWRGRLFVNIGLVSRAWNFVVWLWILLKLLVGVWFWPCISSLIFLVGNLLSLKCVRWNILRRIILHLHFEILLLQGSTIIVQNDHFAWFWRWVRGISVLIILCICLAGCLRIPFRYICRRILGWGCCSWNLSAPFRWGCTTLPSWLHQLSIIMLNFGLFLRLLCVLILAVSSLIIRLWIYFSILLVRSSWKIIAHYGLVRFKILSNAGIYSTFTQLIGVCSSLNLNHILHICATISWPHARIKLLVLNVVLLGKGVLVGGLT